MNQPDMFDVYGAMHTLEHLFGVRIKVELSTLPAGDYGAFRYHMRAIAYREAETGKWARVAASEAVWPSDATKHFMAATLKLVLDLDYSLTLIAQPPTEA